MKYKVFAVICCFTFSLFASEMPRDTSKETPVNHGPDQKHDDYGQRGGSEGSFDPTGSYDHNDTFKVAVLKLKKEMQSENSGAFQFVLKKEYLLMSSALALTVLAEKFGPRFLKRLLAISAASVAINSYAYTKEKEFYAHHPEEIFNPNLSDTKTMELAYQNYEVVLLMLAHEKNRE